MIMDKLAEFADAVALSTSGTGIQLVGNQIDLEQARDIGNGEPLYLVIQVDTAIAGTSSTVQFILASDAQAGIATNGTATEHFRSAAIPEASLVKGYQMAVAVPMESPAYERYLGILVNVGAAALSAGKINAFLTHDVAKWKATADALA